MSSCNGIGVCRDRMDATIASTQGVPTLTVVIPKGNVP